MAYVRSWFFCETSQKSTRYLEACSHYFRQKNGAVFFLLSTLCLCCISSEYGLRANFKCELSEPCKCIHWKIFRSIVFPLLSLKSSINISVLNYWLWRCNICVGIFIYLQYIYMLKKDFPTIPKYGPMFFNNVHSRCAK